MGVSGTIQGIPVAFQGCSNKSQSRYQMIHGHSVRFQGHSGALRGISRGFRNVLVDSIGVKRAGTESLGLSGAFQGCFV